MLSKEIVQGILLLPANNSEFKADRLLGICRFKQLTANPEFSRILKEPLNLLEQ
jgi:hypothetical protein